jgi:bacterioferritin-associated ferredoxin
MIVCVCKAVSDRTIRAALADGVSSFDELQFELGVATCCGKCESVAREMVDCHAACAHRPAHAAPVARPSVQPMYFYERKAA